MKQRPALVLRRLIRSRISAVLSASALLVLGCGCGKKTEEKADVIILHTGRLLGNVYPRNAASVSPLQYFPLLAGYVKQARSEAEANHSALFLFDLGDSLDGSFASHATGSRNMVEFFNALQYDALCLGNLDGSVDPAAIGKLDAPVLCPFLGADGKPAMPGTQVATTLRKSGQSLTLAANFYGDTAPEQYPLRFPTQFGPDQALVTPVRDYRQVLQSAKRQGNLKVLSWMKLESPGKPPSAFLDQLSKLGFDLIIAHRIYGGSEKGAWAGASFMDTKPPASVNILRSNLGFTLARVELKRSEEGWHVLRQSLVPLTSNSAPPDPEIVTRIDSLRKPSEKQMRRLQRSKDRGWNGRSSNSMLRL